MMRITKDGYTIEADTQAELDMALAALKSTESNVALATLIPHGDEGYMRYDCRCSICTHAWDTRTIVTVPV